MGADLCRWCGKHKDARHAAFDFYTANGAIKIEACPEYNEKRFGQFTVIQNKS